ncbi:MAG: Rne/Rng family ribonuclease [Candidatus Scatovivens sp.]
MKQIVIKKKEENENLILVLEDGILVEKHLENTENRNIEGNIFIGKVQNVLPGLESAFVNIGKNRNAFITIKDILPKEDITKNKKSKKDIDPINKLIKPGDPIIVQVKKDTTTKKGVRVTTHLNIPGRFVVLCPNTPFITVSQKVKEKDRLKKIVSENLPTNLGAIVRTNAEKAKEEEIILDIKNLINKWNQIKNTPINNYPKQIYDSGGIIRKLLIDIIDSDLQEIILEDENLESQIREFLETLNKDVKLIIDKDNILYNYNLDRQLKNTEKRKIYLKSGGFITIDKTEALTAIDVNSGKSIGKNNAEDTIFNVNYEATIEILKQIRIRDIGGIIIIDYIDMNLEENKKKIIELLKKEIKKDRSKVQIEGFTKLNLMELTRKHLYNNS